MILRKSWGKQSWSLQPRLPSLVDFDDWQDESHTEESRAQTSAPRDSSRYKQYRGNHFFFKKAKKLLSLLKRISDDVSTYLSREGKWSRSQFGTFHAQDPLIRTRKVWFTIFPLNRSEEFKVDEAYSINRLNIHIHSAPPPNCAH
jgi:hypothetical protein